MPGLCNQRDLDQTPLRMRAQVFGGRDDQGARGKIIAEGAEVGQPSRSPHAAAITRQS